MEHNDMKMRLVILSSATRALALKRKNPKMSDDEIIKDISHQANTIIAEAE